MACGKNYFLTVFHIVYRILIPLKQHILIRTRSVLVVLCSLLCPKESKPRESICVLIQPASDACTVYCFSVLSPQPIWKKEWEKRYLAWHMQGAPSVTQQGITAHASNLCLSTIMCLLAVYKHQIVVANQNKKNSSKQFMCSSLLTSEMSMYTACICILS